MQYFGGKQRISKELAGYMQPFVNKAEAYWEPFVGGASVCSKIVHDKRYASDANVALITMWKALQAGWIPPEIVTEDEYRDTKNKRDENDPMTAFIGFGCSFAGKWYGGYARNKNGTNYARGAKNSLRRKDVSGVTFSAHDFAAIRPSPNDVVYCDPPYQGTTGYGATGKFDWKRFWDWVADVSCRGVIVFVSEYIAPPGFSVAWETQTKTDIRDKDGLKSPRTERLFRWDRT